MRRESSVEYGSLVIAMIAIILSGVSTWEQFFHASSSLRAVPQVVSLDMRPEPAELRLSVLMMNSSETPGVLQRAHLFLSADGSTPGRAYSSAPNETFWWGETLNEPIVISENSIRQIVLSLNLEPALLERFRQATRRDPSGGTRPIGVVLSSMDIEGRNHLEEVFVGEVRADGLGVLPGQVRPMDLY